MALSVPGAPSSVSAALDALTQALVAEAGDVFAGLVLYGGLARGRFREGLSDVNVVVLLHHADRAALDRVAAPLRAARRTAAVEAMILTPAEVPAAAFEFPTKFLDIKRHHIVLAGVDPFAALEVPRVMVQLRIAQSLRNLLLRLRRRYAIANDDGPALRSALTEVARPLAIEMLALLYDGGHDVPPADQTSTVFDAAAKAFVLDAATLAELAALRADARKNGRGDAQALFGRVLAVITQLSDRADALAGAAE